MKTAEEVRAENRRLAAERIKAREQEVEEGSVEKSTAWEPFGD